MGTGGQREDTLGEPAQEHHLELQALGLVDGEHLHGVPAALCRLGLVHRPRDVGVQAVGHVRDQGRLALVEPLPDLLQLPEGVERGAELYQRLLPVGFGHGQREDALHHTGFDQDPVGERREGEAPGAADGLVVGAHRAVDGGELVVGHVLDVRWCLGWCLQFGPLSLAFPRCCCRGEACLALGGAVGPREWVGGWVCVAEPVEEVADDAGAACGAGHPSHLRRSSSRA